MRPDSNPKRLNLRLPTVRREQISGLEVSSLIVAAHALLGLVFVENDGCMNAQTRIGILRPLLLRPELGSEESIILLMAFCGNEKSFNDGTHEPQREELEVCAPN